MLEIPIQPVPSQIVKAVLGGQNCQIAIYVKNGSVFVDLNSNGEDISNATIAQDCNVLNPISYEGFLGNLIFNDDQGTSDPDYTQFGSRFVLLYLTPAEVAAINPPLPALPPSINLLIDDYTPLGTIDGSNVDFAALYGPINPLHVLIFINGLFQTNGVDYTFSGTSPVDIVFTVAPPAGTMANPTIILMYYQTGIAVPGLEQETPGGAINGSNVTFTLSQAPSPAVSLQLFRNGAKLRQGIGLDYTLSGATITFAIPPVLLPSEDILQAVYRTSTIPPYWNFADAEIPAGAINGSNTTFTLLESPSPAPSLQLYYNEQLLTFGLDFTVLGATITTNFTPGGSDVLEAFYRY